MREARSATAGAHVKAFVDSSKLSVNSRHATCSSVVVVFQMMKSLKYKAIFIGECGVGKTSIVHRLAGACYPPHPGTIGCDFMRCKYCVDGEECAEITLYDTAGQERYAPLGRPFYHDAHIVFLVYSVNDIRTFQRVH